MTIERIVNICWQADDEDPTGHVSIFRPINDQHETDLTKKNEFAEIVVAEASPLACPVEEDLSKSKFCEKYGTVPTWVGMKRGDRENKS